jgi:hypothetical protein
MSPKYVAPKGIILTYLSCTEIVEVRISLLMFRLKVCFPETICSTLLFRYCFDMFLFIEKMWKPMPKLAMLI